MAVTINGTTGITSPGGDTSTSLSTGSLTTSGTSTVSALAVNGNNISATNSLGFRNRIINGDMRIDQRNAGASVTASDTGNAVYVVDRWAYRVLAASKLSFQRSTVAPAGFTNSLLVTSLSSYSVANNEFFSVRQPIEGFNVADLGWGSAGAIPVTLSFWVRSSLTGTFGGGLWNNAENRYYAFSYAINAANTWEQKSITISGDTTGTWVTGNTTGLMLSLNLGSGGLYTGAAGSWGSSVIIAPTGQVNVAGTNGATFYITGVQLEAGSAATPFERRPYGTEDYLCKRYFWNAVTTTTTSAILGSGQCYSTTGAIVGVTLPAPMRATPSISQGNLGVWNTGASTVAVTALSVGPVVNNSYMRLDVTTASGLTAGSATFLHSGTGGSGVLSFNSEL